MQRLVLMLLCAATCNAFGQGNTLYQVNLVKPKPGMTSAFETTWKTHRDKFHSKDDKRTVYEITSGPDEGSFIIVEGPFSYADMDKEKTNSKEHGLDLEKNFSPKVEPNNESALFRWADTLSYNGDAKADKFLVTVTQVKDGKMGEYLTEIRRNATVSANLKSPFSYNVLVKQQAGSSPMLVTIRNLKNGFKELETNYFNLPQNGFRDEYAKLFGQDAWDQRQKLLVDDIISREQHFERLRPDLSSK
jgi:hypothetical protein